MIRRCLYMSYCQSMTDPSWYPSRPVYIFLAWCPAFCAYCPTSLSDQICTEASFRESESLCLFTAFRFVSFAAVEPALMTGPFFTGLSSHRLVPLNRSSSILDWYRLQPASDCIPPLYCASILRFPFRPVRTTAFVTLTFARPLV